MAKSVVFVLPRAPSGRPIASTVRMEKEKEKMRKKKKKRGHCVFSANRKLKTIWWAPSDLHALVAVAAAAASAAAGHSALRALHVKWAI